MKATRTREHELHAKEQALLQSNVEKVKALLISKGAEDLIDMLTAGVGDVMITELSNNPNGRR